MVDAWIIQESLDYIVFLTKIACGIESLCSVLVFTHGPYVVDSKIIV